MSFDKNSGGYGNSGLTGPVFDISLHIAGPGKKYDGVFIIGNMKTNGGNENTWNDYTVYPDTACYIEPNIYRNW